MAKLNNWFVVAAEPQTIIPGLTQSGPKRYKLEGEVQGHTKLKDGSVTTTSPVVQRHGDNVITTSGTEYELGEIFPLFAQRFPNIKQVLLDSLPERGF